MGPNGKLKPFFNHYKNIVASIYCNSRYQKISKKILEKKIKCPYIERVYEIKSG